jgi:hypothetical protein
MSFAPKSEAYGDLNAYPFDSVTQRCFDEIEKVAGLPLRDNRNAFDYFHKFISTEPVPMYINAWRNNASTDRWYRRHVNGILGDVQNGLACANYHKDNLVAVEAVVRQIVDQSGIRPLLNHRVVGGGNTLRLDAEYQAFVLAVRRTLDYFARALAAYFRNDLNSFRKLPEVLTNWKPRLVAEAIQSAHARHVGLFAYVLSDGSKKSIRDLLSHYEYIGAGTINIAADGLYIAGGGENLDPFSAKETLGASIQRKAKELEICIADVLISFTNAAESENRRYHAELAVGR